MKFEYKNLTAFSLINRLILISYCFFVMGCIFAYAQPRQTHRFETKQKDSDEYYSIIPLKEEGLALLREKNKYNGGKRLWELTLLDTALQERKTFDIEVEHRYLLI